MINEQDKAPGLPELNSRGCVFGSDDPRQHRKIWHPWPWRCLHTWALSCGEHISTAKLGLTGLNTVRAEECLHNWWIPRYGDLKARIIICVCGAKSSTKPDKYFMLDVHLPYVVWACSTTREGQDLVLEIPNTTLFYLHTCTSLTS
jgi:hypothetical protein